MRPPQRDIRGRKFDPQGGGLIRFSGYAPLPDGLTGHPDNVEWFCERHFDAADALSELCRAYGRSGRAPAWLATLRKQYLLPR